VSDYVNLLIQLGFRIMRLEEPELTTEGQHEVGANAYSAGPTRLMLLAQVLTDESPVGLPQTPAWFSRPVCSAISLVRQAHREAARYLLTILKRQRPAP
jgi:hypothetical protein